MPTFTLSRKAKADLRAIAQYTERRWGREQRNEYVLAFDQAFHRLAERPELGRPCEGVRAGYRQQPQGSHLIFYLTENSTVHIVRILHKRMMPNEHLS
jgi:toxin ParE1/3/4